MSEPHKPNRSLSDISHLFLSSVRDRQTNGAPRPHRTPPGSHSGSSKPDVSIDLTPEELARVMGGAAIEPVDEMPTTPITALIGGHLNGKQFDRAKEYACHLAVAGRRVALIEVDASEFRLLCFEHGKEMATAGSFQSNEYDDPRDITSAIEELSWDVDQWLLVLPNGKTPEALNLLRAVDYWTLLCTCDHDGVVSCYRTLKGLADVHRKAFGDSSPAYPRLSLALLDARDEIEADRVYRKLSGVCEQFLRWPLGLEPSVRKTVGVAEHLIALWRVGEETGGKPEGASTSHWEVVGDFLKRAGASASRPCSEPPSSADSSDVPMSSAISSEPSRRHVGDVVVGSFAAHLESKPVIQPAIPSPEMSPMTHSSSSIIPANPAGGTEVIDLGEGNPAESSILAAVVRHENSGLVECPIRPPACPEARLAVGRDRRIVMLALARQGLSDLHCIGQAYRWLSENRALISMAMPQFAIDAHAFPHLRLLVDQADLNTQALAPMLQSGHVVVQAYRTLRWGTKTGLLLEAA